jgi:MoxR-like ATPase
MIQSSDPIVPQDGQDTQESAAHVTIQQQRFTALRDSLQQSVIGQPHLIDCLLIALLADGHLLVEGAPGLAKTTAVKALAERIEANFHRVQFTPDLLPADLTGTDVFHPQTGNFEFERGPLFHNLVLADEINRAPAKVQSALLEAMAERQITVGKHTWPLPELFLVMATQNPIEQEGTFSLPEAQLDRFIMHVTIGYPKAAAEQAILELARKRNTSAPTSSFKPLTQLDIFAARKQVAGIYSSELVDHYLVQLVLASRNPTAYDRELAHWIAWGASPRATIALDNCARAKAWLDGRNYVTPADVQSVAHEVLRHRILLSYEAEAEGITPDQLIARLLELVPLP